MGMCNLLSIQQCQDWYEKCITRSCDLIVKNNYSNPLEFGDYPIFKPFMTRIRQGLVLDPIGIPGVLVPRRIEYHNQAHKQPISPNEWTVKTNHPSKNNSIYRHIII